MMKSRAVTAAWLLGLVLLVGAAHAANLGAVRVFSRAGEPLKAEVALTGVNTAEAGALRAGIASADLFAASGIEYQPALDLVKVSVVRSGEGFALRLSSDEPINASMLNPIIELNDNGNTSNKSISLPLSGYRPAPEPTPAPAAMAAAGSALPPWPVPTAGVAATPPTVTRAPAAPAGAAPAAVKVPMPASAVTAPLKAPEVVKAAAPAMVATAPAGNVAPPSDDIDVIKGQLEQAKSKIEKLAKLSDDLNRLVTVQQQLIDKQAGVLPAEATTPGAAAIARALPVDPNAPLAAAEERESIDPVKVLILLAATVLVAVVLWSVVGALRRRLQNRPLYLPSPRVAARN